MDFSGRGAQTPTNRSTSPTSTAPTTGLNGSFKHFSGKPAGKWLQVASVVLLFSVTVLVVTISLLLYVGRGNSEAKQVDAQKYQAVFLNNGQVYFGHVKDLNNRYVDLRDIYYLQTSQNGSASTNTTANANTNVSLVKLGCELHAPEDQMLINDSQVLFWENLNTTGQVAKAIDQYKQQNPKGQTCSTASQSSTQQAPAATNDTTNTQTNTTTNSTTTKKQ